ncbi:MAG TPA: TrkH family potassium uptake protein [Sedimentisphaerales bacterium]|nr:TrkH family potassium uptake protein [Sedimentisphaerales bacterium]
MRNGFQRINCILHFVGGLLEILGLVLLLPLAVVLIYWGQMGDGWITATAFVVTALISFSLGLVLRNKFESDMLDTTGSMLMCALGWLFASAIGALPFVIAIGSNCLDAYFEAMSGFTTTGITVFSGLDNMPRSILFWRSLTQWLGGIGILSFFLMVIFQSGGAHHMFGAESHKISSVRPAPGLFHTLRILWAIYAMFTVFAAVILALEKMPVFDAVCHALTALSTGGFSPHDSSIEFYSLTGHPNYRLIEYTLTFLMMLGGINFLVHYRVLTRDFKALWDNTEIRYWWRLIAGFTAVIIIDHLYKTGAFTALFRDGTAINPGEFERTFRHSLFQVMSILTTTGFGTKDIGSDFFGVLSKQLFLAMMVIGGCVGSTGGGFKVLRVAILNRLILRELLKLRISGWASSGVVIDKKIVPEDEVDRVAALFFTWMALLLVGGGITAFCSNLGPWESFSGMFSAMGNIGPCYISVPDMIAINPIVKLTYIFGMLAGRLEILPVLLLFSRKAWK